MLDMNIDHIVNGTFHKRLARAYEQMKSDGLTTESAEKYKQIYENESLSNILSESELIFKEPIYGLDFFVETLMKEWAPLHSYPEQIDKLNNYMTEYGSLMSDEQKSKYESATNTIQNMMETRKNEISFSTYNLDSTSDLYHMIETMCDDLYNMEETIPDSVNTFFESASMEFKLLYGYYFLPRVDINRLSKLLYNEMVMSESSKNDINSYTRISRANVISSFLLNDSAIWEDIAHTNNINLSMIMNESKEENFRSIVDSIFTEYVSGNPVEYLSPEDAVMQMFSDDEFYENVQDQMLNIRLVNASKAKAVLESVLNIVYNEWTHTKDESLPTSCKIVNELSGSNLSIKEAVDYLMDKVNAMDETIHIILEDSEENSSFFEYTRRGEATPVIRKTAGNLREEPWADNRRKKSADDSSDYDDEDEDDDEPQQKKKSSVNKSTKSRNDDVSDDDLDEMDQEENDRTSQQKKTGKPELQKQSLTRKIQNKAIDMDVKMQKKGANAKQAATEVKNAAKAMLRLPANIIKSLKTGIEEWNTMDENKRKEKILQPGYRTKIFKHLKTAIMYGAIWEYKKYMVIVTFICKHTILHPFFKANTERTKRLRNELTAELETEIAVTDEKIEDARANGDQKQKYELIRIKKKLEAEKVRVATNSKYI